MREDLIERLRELIDNRCGDGPSGPNYDPELLDVLSEAAAAIESAPVLESSVPVGMEAAVERLKDRTFPKHECPAESAAVWNTALYEMQRVLAQQPAADGYCVTRSGTDGCADEMQATSGDTWGESPAKRWMRK